MFCRRWESASSDTLYNIRHSKRIAEYQRKSWTCEAEATVKKYEEGALENINISI